MADELRWKLIVGLGNPGPKYEGNRHNVGFRCLDELAQAHDLAFTGLEAKAHIARGKIADQPVILAKPLIFINESGPAVRELTALHGYEPGDILVVHDDLDLPLGRIRLRPRGSSAGHKGVQSIIDALGTEEFARLRVGIGRPPAGVEVVDYVLSDFSEEELAIMTAIYEEAVGAIEAFLRLGIEEAMNRYN
ncbi:MAG: aminoacyl-tRNA hydrolase [Chloroflexota bacterium]|nr:aminoacyl-tRNA hydrolase [Chloroflexota bacterium]